MSRVLKWLVPFRTMSSSTTTTHLPKMQFYRRVLPESCIAFSSQEGKRLFAESFAAGHMECYFKLAEQFRTQDEPAFCGLSTLVMVLNALHVDPGKVWKGPWRWYHENMLDCCIPLDVITEQGITLDQFSCLADCNTLTVKTIRANTSASLEAFRDLVQFITTVDNQFVVCSYSRKVLAQTGDGHFSPIGGYHPGKDLALILDTARFKYPPHWVPLQLLWTAMQRIDNDTGIPRGYCIMQKKEGEEPLMLFRPSANLSVTMPHNGERASNIQQFLDTWSHWLEAIPSPDAQTHPDDIIKIAVEHILKASTCLGDDDFLYTTQMDVGCNERFIKSYGKLVIDILEGMENLSLLKTVENAIEGSELNPVANRIGRVCEWDRNKCGSGASDQDMIQKLISQIQSHHFITLLLISWPYRFNKGCKTNGRLLDDTLQAAIATSNATFLNEVHWLRQKIQAVLNYFDTHPLCNSCSSKTCGKML